MSKRAAFDLKIDVSDIEGLADKLAKLTPEAVGGLMVDAINQVANNTYALARKTMLGGINLTDDYVQRKMQVVPATAAKPEASIVAFGGRGFTTRLSHYGAMQQTKSVKYSKRSRGNQPLGIPAGSKSAGVSVEVVTGARKTLQYGFRMPGKKDTEGNLLLFTRNKEGKIRSRSGPSVYQLFRIAAGTIEDRVYGDLGRAVIDRSERQFQKELT